ncbi:MAG TPA: hypothetical protein VMZ11_00605 [Mycobacteriales bacterium]|nr:hypothetical protein [Mycobacteriales bacterium]
MAGTCRVHLLGGFEVEVDGHAVPDAAWRGRSTDVVLHLAVEPTHHLTAGEIGARIWPSASTREAEHELAKAVKDARKALGDGRAVTTEGERLRLWPHGELWVDVHTFAARAKHARSPEMREEALAMYRGDLLPDWPDPALDGLRTRLRLTQLELQRDPNGLTPAWVDLRTPLRDVVPYRS